MHQKHEQKDTCMHRKGNFHLVGSRFSPLMSPQESKRVVAEVEMSPKDALDYQKFVACRHGLRVIHAH